VEEAAPVSCSALTVPESSDNAVEAKSDLPAVKLPAYDAPAQNNQAYLKSEFHGDFKPNSDTEYRGLFRHRLIVGGSIFFAISLFVFSLLDLKSLVKTTGFIDSTMHITENPKRARLSPELAYVDNLSKDGLSKVRESGWNIPRIGYVDLSGKTVIKPVYQDIGDFSEGLAEVSIYSKTNDRCVGYIDKAGEIVIPAIYEKCSPFSGGTALAYKKDTTYLIDKTGKVLFQTVNPPPGTTYEPTRSEAALKLDEKEYAPNGQTRLDALDPDHAPAGTPHFVTVPSGFVGLLDAKGGWLIKPEYDSIRSVSDDNNVGYLTPEHEVYTYSYTYSQGRKTARFGIKDSPAYIVEKRQLFGVVDDSGKEILAPQFTRISSYQNGHAAVRVNDKYGFVDSTGKFVIKPQYDYVTAFDKIIAVKNGKVWSFIDSSGKPVAGPSVDGIVHSGRGVWLSEGLGAVLQGDKIGFLNAQGKFTIAPQYKWALAFSNGYAPVYDGSFWHYIDKSGRRVSPNLGTANTLIAANAEISLPGPLYSFVEFSDIDNFNNTVNGWKGTIRTQSITASKPPIEINDDRY